MRGVFDEEEREPAPAGQDKELTLGSGSLLAILFVLVILCGLCFGLGYVVGHRGAKPATVVTSTPASDQEPLQASGTIPKPSAIAQDVAAPPPAAPNSTSGTGSAAGSAAGPAAGPAAAPVAAAPESAPGSSSAVQGAAPQGQQPQVHAALPSVANAPEPQRPAPVVRPAYAPPATIMVQVAAVANPDDANVLVGALRKRNYAVTARREAADNLIHVQIGPFSTLAEADQWRMKLLNDGYNAIVQP